MSKQDAVRAAQLGRKEFERWQHGHYEPGGIDLSGTDLSGVDLRWVNFAGMNLEDVDFSDAKLTGAYFGPRTFDRTPPFVSAENTPVRLTGAKFTRSLLLAATFNYPEIEGASFENAFLGLANFRSVEFSRNSFRNASTVNTSFLNCNLNGAIDLDTVQQMGPSHLDVDTLLRSQGVSRQFLQIAGVPPSLIEYLPDFRMAGQPVAFYSCFLSHAKADKQFCDKLYKELIDHGLKVWYAPEDMKGGQLILPQITEAIRVYDKIIIVLSEHSMKSQWVAREIRWARKREAQTKTQVLFPISIAPFERVQEWEMIESESGIDLAAEIRSYYIPDFSQDALFKKMCTRLIGDLKATEITDQMSL